MVPPIPDRRNRLIRIGLTHFRVGAGLPARISLSLFGQPMNRSTTNPDSVSTTAYGEFQK